MQMDRSRRLVALALGTTAVFDVTGTVIYRVLRSGLPPAPPPEPATEPFRQATRDLQDARREAVMRARDEDGVSLPA